MCHCRAPRITTELRFPFLPGLRSLFVFMALRQVGQFQTACLFSQLEHMGKMGISSAEFPEVSCCLLVTASRARAIE